MQVQNENRTQEWTESSVRTGSSVRVRAGESFQSNCSHWSSQDRLKLLIFDGVASPLLRGRIMPNHLYFLPLAIKINDWPLSFTSFQILKPEGAFLVLRVFNGEGGELAHRILPVHKMNRGTDLSHIPCYSTAPHLMCYTNALFVEATSAQFNVYSVTIMSLIQT